MKKLLKGIVGVAATGVAATGVIAINLIKGHNRNVKEIERLINRTNDLEDELRTVKQEKWNHQHQINMMKIDVEHNNKLQNKVFKLEMDNITLKSQAHIAARRDDRSEPEFYSDIIAEKEKAKREEEELQEANAISEADVILERNIELLDEAEEENTAVAIAE